MVLHTTLEDKQECWQPVNRLRVAHKCDIFQVKAKVPPPEALRFILQALTRGG